VNARLDSTLDSQEGFTYATTTKPKHLHVENYKYCVALISTGRGVFIVVQGEVTDLVKLVTHQVVSGRPSHMVGWPWSSASMDL
jgi:hypothetical protein